MIVEQLFWSVVRGLILVLFCAALSASSSPAVGSLQKQSDLSELINELRSSNSRTREEAIYRLIKLGQSSQATRKSIIDALLIAVNSENELDGSHTILKTTFSFWRGVTDIFIVLDAIEATDVLVRCIHCSNGYSGSMGEPPASVALVRLGTPVLPKLAYALRTDTDAYIRVKIVLCIARIGGPQAIIRLKQASRVERDKHVRNTIQSALSELRSRD
jgi:HEAT repeat protein